jgi:preprotein translocase subunit SecE
VSEKKLPRLQNNIFQRFGQNIQRTFRETIGELRKVSWPTRQEAFNLTKIVLAVIVGMGLFLGILDVLFTEIFRLILGI